MLEQIPEMQLIFHREKLKFNQHLPHTDFQASFLELRHAQTSIPYIFAQDIFSSKEELLESFAKITRSYEKPQNFQIEGGGKITIKNYKITITHDPNFKKYHEEIIRPIMKRYFARHIPGAQLILE